MRRMRVVAAGARTRMARLSALASVALAACVLAGALSQAAQGEPMWTTYHRDSGRSGNDPDASNPVTPTLAWQSLDLGAPIWGQPLVLGSRTYVATVGDKIYALDTSSGKVLWEKSAGVAVPSSELPCGDIDPTVGIVGTPVIDASSQVIYAVADTWNAMTKEAHHVLKGYSLSAGAEMLSTAVDPPGSDPKALLQRTALNLDAGSVVFGLGGNDGDCGEYRGTVVAAPESGGSPLYWRYQPAPPSNSGGAVWGPSGPAVDGEGHIYASTGNPNPQGGKAEIYDYSDSLVELSSSLSQIGSFEPESWLQDSNGDADLGSAGAELLPGGLLFQSGKNRMGYLIDESKLGEGAPAVFSHQVCGGGGSFGGDAFANGTIYVPCTDGVRALAYNQVARTFTALWQGPSDANGPPIVSGGLVWSVATGGGGGTKLYGIDPSTGKPRYTETLPSAVADHFASPSAGGGRLFLATGSTVSAYQIARLAPIVTTGAASSIASTTATLNATVNPNGGEVTKCEFEYGTTVAYGSTAQCSALPGSGSSPVAVSAATSSLTANTTYHFRIVATNAGETSKGSDETLTTASNAPTAVSKPALSIASTTATLNATVNPNGGEVTKCEFEYGTTNAYGATASCSALPGSGSSPVPVSAAITSLTPNTVYHFRISATNAGGTSKGLDETFTTAVSPPTVMLCEAFATQTFAMLCAKVNPNGREVSECKFEYGPTNAYGSSVPCVPNPGSGSNGVEVNGEIPDPTANTTYHYRIVAANPGGTTKGSDATFKTLPNPPTVVTGSASPFAQTTATLNGTVNPNGSEVSQCEFEYGTTNTYGSTASCASLPGGGTTTVEVAAALSSLTANTTYHFRISATNAGGTSKGSDETFTTLVSPPTLAICAPVATQTTATLCARVNPNGEEVSECQFEYGPTNAYGSSVPCAPKPGSGTSAVEVNGEITGLMANTTYHYRFVATTPGSTSKGPDETFKSLPNPPTVVTGPASSFAQTTATLNATVNPNGGEVSQCRFEYGTTNSYGSIAPCSSLPGAGTSPVEVSASVTSLTAKTIYHFRISATQAGGSSFGADQAFATLPVAVLLPQTLLQGPGSQPVSLFGEHQTPRVPDVKLASTWLAVSSSGTFTIKVSCPAGETICRGTTTLRTLNTVSAGETGTHLQKRILTLATGSFAVAGGRFTTVKLRLIGKARTLLARLHVLRVRATTVAHDPAGAAHTTQTIVTIHAATPRRGRER